MRRHLVLDGVADEIRAEIEWLRAAVDERSRRLYAELSLSKVADGIAANIQDEEYRKVFRIRCGLAAEYKDRG